MKIEYISQCLGTCILILASSCAYYKSDLTIKSTNITAPKSGKYEASSTAPLELERIHTAWRNGKGDEFNFLKKIVKMAENSQRNAINFPVSGSQHGQWYQCKKCEYKLRTISPTQHKCDLCGKIYSGYPYDQCLYKHAHGKNFADMFNNARAYTITQDTKFAEFVKAMLMGYADRYLKYKYHDPYTPINGRTSTAGGHIFEQSLDEAFVASSRIAPAYDMVKESGVFSQKDILKIKKGLIIPMLENIGKNNRGKNNWQTWHNAAMISLGAAFDEPEWITRGIYDPHNGFYYQMKNSVTKDGFWYEGSMGYHFYALSALIYSAESSRKKGINLWKTPELKKMILTPLLYRMPDRTLPCFGDSVRRIFKLKPFIAETAWKRLKAPELASFLPKSSNWESIKFGRNINQFSSVAKTVLKSCVFKNSGHAILRGRGPKGLTVAFSFSPYKNSHSHYDILSFAFYGFKKEICVDSGRADNQAYSLPIHKDWYKGRISHNAVFIANQPQKKSKSSKLLFFKTGGECQYVAAETSSAYSGVTQIRLLALTKDYLLVFDLLNSDNAAIFSLGYHINSEYIKASKMMAPSPTTNTGAGFKYIRNTRKGKAQNISKFEFVNADIKTFLTVFCRGELDILSGDGPRKSVTDRIPLVFISNSKKQKNISFASIIEPVKKTKHPFIKNIQVTKQKNTYIITVYAENKKDIFTFSKDTGLRWELCK